MKGVWKTEEEWRRMTLGGGAAPKLLEIKQFESLALGRVGSQCVMPWLCWVGERRQSWSFWGNFLWTPHCRWSCSLSLEALLCHKLRFSLLSLWCPGTARLKNKFNLSKVKGRKQHGRCDLTAKIDPAVEICCPSTRENARKEPETFHYCFQKFPVSICAG